MNAADPLHGMTLEAILTYLVDLYGWEQLGDGIRINCFNDNPSIKSSLTFLRKTPWARKKVEALYVNSITLKTGAAEPPDKSADPADPAASAASE
jgi:uncharacterized protein (DUF2132 family)